MIAAEWPAPPGVVAGTTTRQGGVSAGPWTSLNLGAHVGDDPAAVAENRARLAAGVGLPTPPRWLDQVHGTRVVRAGAGAFDNGPPAADASVCHKGRHVLAILTADCLPILLCATDSPALGALHCGWRSMAGGLIGKAVRAMPGRPSSLLAWLGPAIAQPAFEVGDEVRDLFLAGIEGAAACFEPNARGRWQADLYGLARLFLAHAGVERVYGGRWCTYTQEQEFFSHRRDGVCGRMASLIFRRDA